MQAQGPSGDSVGGITDVPGVAVGHFTDPRRPTGCTVVLVREGATGAVDVRGGAPGTRELELLDPVNIVDVVHAVLLAGGSAFGLDAAGGVMRFLEEQGVGVAVGAARVPIVPAAILFDLAVGDGHIRPDAEAGYAAARAAAPGAVAEGSVGAGAGATVGKMWGFDRAMKGGVGTASLRLPDGSIVGALAAVNAFGDVVGEDGRVIAGARSRDGSRLDPALAGLVAGRSPLHALAGTNTTLAVVATSASLTKAEAARVARMAQDGLARAIVPAHTPFDGDLVFALSTGRSGRADVLAVGALAAAALSHAVRRAVQKAQGVQGIPCIRDLQG